jgi:hypothetical protein
MRDALQPFVVREEPEHSFLPIECGTGSAHVNLDENDMMANHIAGDEPREILVQGARAAGWVILPVGCSACITAEDQGAYLPDGLNENVALVETGLDLEECVPRAFAAQGGAVLSRPSRS